MTSRVQLNLVVALPCEARIFLDKYHLQRLDNPFPLFTNAAQDVHLIISGVGKVKSAMATTYLHAFTGFSPNTSYLNIGIAGSDQLAVGKIFLINKIVDNATKKSFYPFPILNQIIPSIALLTVDQSLDHYPPQQLIDMEAAGFYQAVSQFLTQEHAQILKIVSDNPQQTMQMISPQKVTAWMEQQWPFIAQVIDYQQQKIMLKATWKNVAHSEFSAFLQRWHFTVYQQHQLRELLRRWQVMIPNESALSWCYSTANSKMVLKKMDEKLQAEFLCKSFI